MSAYKPEHASPIEIIGFREVEQKLRPAADDDKSVRYPWNRIDHDDRLTLVTRATGYMLAGIELDAELKQSLDMCIGSVYAASPPETHPERRAALDHLRTLIHEHALDAEKSG